MPLIEWLAKRSATCAELQAERDDLLARCALTERAFEITGEALRSSRARCHVLAEGFAEQERAAEDILAVATHLMRERDALARELAMERLRLRELREQLAAMEGGRA